MAIDNEIQQIWIKNVYKKELPTMGNNLIATGGSLLATTFVTYFAQEKGINSEEALTAIATITDLTTYYLLFFGQLLYRDRKELLDNNERLKPKKVFKKVGEYFSLGATIFFSYGFLRSTAHYILQKKGIDPVTASTGIQIGLATLYTGVMPILRHTSKKLWK